MNQEQVNVLFNITILIHEDAWFGKRATSRNRETVQAWVTEQLADHMGVYTKPCGSSWGVLCTKEEFEEWRKERIDNKEMTTISSSSLFIFYFVIFWLVFVSIGEILFVH